MELFRFGVIADIQYADIDDAYSFSGSQQRKYRGALDALKSCVEFLNSHELPFLLQLGDIIDGQNAGKVGQLKGQSPQSDIALKKVLKELEWLDSNMKIYHSVGNHELYNFSWDVLHDKLNFKNHIISQNGKFYFGFDVHKNWRVLHLNPYEVTLMQHQGYEGYKIARDLLENENPNFNDFIPEFEPDIESTGRQVNYFKDMPKHKQFLCPFNGGLMSEQMLWLENELRHCKQHGKKVIMTTHVPLSREGSDYQTCVFNHEEITDLMKKYSNTVRAVFSGHCHQGGYEFSKELQCGFVTVQSPLVFGDACAMVKVLDNDSIEIHGLGGVPSRTIHFDSCQNASY